MLLTEWLVVGPPALRPTTSASSSKVSPWMGIILGAPPRQAKVVCSLSHTWSSSYTPADALVAS